jgi:hypothetical protein
MFEEMSERLEHDELLQMSDKLQMLYSTTEQSSLVARVEETITQIESLTSKGDR